MKYFSVFIISCFLLPSCAQNMIANNPADYEKLIVGSWVESKSADGENLFINTYFSDGRTHGYGYFDKKPSGEFYHGTGTWKIIDGASCLTIYESTESSMVGNSFCNSIILLNDKVFVFESHGKQVTMYRMSDEAP